MKVTKEIIIDALKTEPLSSGYGWCRRRALDVVGDCEVCAVGAVLRKLKMTNAQILRKAPTLVRNHTMPHGDDEDNVLESALLRVGEENYLGALSTYFEGINRRRYYTTGVLEDFVATSEVREKCIAFVTTHFPDSFDIPDLA